jgi:hypothetical protein
VGRFPTSSPVATICFTESMMSHFNLGDVEQVLNETRQTRGLLVDGIVEFLLHLNVIYFIIHQHLIV